MNLRPIDIIEIFSREASAGGYSVPDVKFTRRDKELDSALDKCAEEAEKSEKLALNTVDALEKVSAQTVRSIENAISKINGGGIKDEETETELIKQLNLVRSGMERLPGELRSKIAALAKENDCFAITLFGASMAGKSTLREILTHGNGDSIGKGGQRTTRNVRDYYYKNKMKITDVPGIGAFRGKEDEEIALEAARKSNLVLYIMLNENPSPLEAEWMSRVISMGKPVICMINVNVGIKKENIGDSVKLKRFERNVHREFQEEKINELKKQFREFGIKNGQNWRRIKFVCVHLKAEFLAQQPDVPAALQKKLHELSKFSYFERMLIKEVSYNGPFYKMKAFMDTITVDITDTLTDLFSESERNSMLGTGIISKRREIEKWQKEFEVTGKAEIATCIASIRNDLKREADFFAENNYESKNVEMSWNELRQVKGIGPKCQEKLEDLNHEAMLHLQEIGRQMNYELQSLEINKFKDIKTRPVSKWKRRIGYAIAEALFVVNQIAGFFGNVVVNVVFDSKDESIEKSKRALRNSLESGILATMTSAEARMNYIFERDLMTAKVSRAIVLLQQSSRVVLGLSEEQWNAAKNLNGILQELNRNLIKKALEYKELQGIEYIHRIARIPGNTIVMVVENGKMLPRGLGREISSLLSSEEVRTVIKKESKKVMIKSIIGWEQPVNLEWIKSDPEPRIAHIASMNEFDAYAMVRVRLAQQITELLMLK